MMRTLRISALALVAALGVQGLPASAQTAGASLGSVRLSRAVVAGGQQLAAGTYTLRVSNEAVNHVLGQADTSFKWVEFVQGGQVKAKELATVLTSAAAREIAEGGVPGSGSSRVQMLKGNDYLRIWINRGGTHYLLHLAVG
jgi:hypothetical protein